MSRRIAIIGAGASGLAVLRRFSESKENFEMVCFEQLSNVAGLWNYCNVIADPDHPTGSQYTAVYKNMRTNLPRQIMVFHGCSYPDDLPSFISHVHVKEYLEKYADIFHLKRYVKFNRKVVSVEPKLPARKEDLWSVSVIDVHTKVQEDFEFDIVIVCSGKHTIPRYPKIEGLEVYRGRAIHSQAYRDPEEFRDQRVLVIGGGPSGIDISDEISRCAAKTWLSIKASKALNVSNKICQLGEVTRLTARSAIVNRIFPNENDYDGDSNSNHLVGSEQTSEDLGGPSYEIGPIDAVLLCTGFRFGFPFLSANSGVATLSPFRVGPLYKDLVSEIRPSLSFVGLLDDVVAFSQFDCQARFLLALYEGRIGLPADPETMDLERQSYDEAKRAHNVDVDRTPFRLSDFHWYYLTHLASIGQFDPPPRRIGDFLQGLIKGGLGDIITNRSKTCIENDDGSYLLV